MTEVTYETDDAGGYVATMHVRDHVMKSDLKVASGGTDSAPGPHDLFDASLCACQGATAMWYAKQKNIPLDKIAVRVVSDDSEERKGVYKLMIHVELTGPTMTDEQRASILRAIASCPIKKLMTTSEVQISYDAS